MADEPINGREPNFSEEDLQRREVGAPRRAGQGQPDEDDSAAGEEDPERG